MSDTVERGDSVTVQTETINDGEPFEANIVSVDNSTETYGVEPADLDIIELAIVGFNEVQA